MILLWSPAPSGALSVEPKDGAAWRGGSFRLTHDKNDVPLTLETAIVRCAPPIETGVCPRWTWWPPFTSPKKVITSGSTASWRVMTWCCTSWWPRKIQGASAGSHGNDHPVTVLQNGIKDLLGLEFQLQGIDYAHKT